MEKDTQAMVKKVINKSIEMQIIDNEYILRKKIIKIEKSVVNTILRDFEVVKNAFDEQSDIITEEEKDSYTDELIAAMALFYGGIIATVGKAIFNKRSKDLKMVGNFKMDNNIKKYIGTMSDKVAESHIDTIINDVLDATRQEYERLVEVELTKIADGKTAGRKVTDADLKLARKKALEGNSRAKITKAIKQTYNGKISNTRAKAIARTETNRAFTEAQYQADKQFLEQNDITDIAYKKWVTTSNNPCPTCIDLSQQDPIPFTVNFADLGDEIVTTYEINGATKVKRLLVDFQPLTAGNAHVNCGCKYELIYKGERILNSSLIDVDWFFIYNNGLDNSDILPSDIVQEYQVNNYIEEKYEEFIKKYNKLIADGKIISRSTAFESFDKIKYLSEKKIETHNKAITTAMNKMYDSLLSEELPVIISIGADGTDNMYAVNNINNFVDIKRGSKKSYDSISAYVLIGKEYNDLDSYINKAIESNRKVIVVATDKDILNENGISSVSDYINNDAVRRNIQTITDNTVNNYINFVDSVYEAYEKYSDNELVEFNILSQINEKVEETDINIIAKNYSPGQPRDKAGKFASGGGGFIDNETLSYDQAHSIAESYSNHKLTKNEELAVVQYSGTHYNDTNRVLRTYSGKSVEKLSDKEIYDVINPNVMTGKSRYDADVSLFPDKVKARIEMVRSADANMSTATKKMELKENTILHRGANNIPKLEVGATFKDDAYISTSMKGSIAKDYGSGKKNDEGNASYYIKIKAQKGTKGVMPLAVNADGITDEVEWILPKGSKFKVDSISTKDGINIAEVSYVGE